MLKTLLIVPLVALSEPVVEPVEVVYTDSIIPYMHISYGPGTVLTPGTEITTDPCVISRVELDSEGVFTITCMRY